MELALKDLLKYWRFPALRLEEPKTLNETWNRCKEQFLHIRPSEPPRVELDQLFLDVREYFNRHRGLAGLDRRSLRLTPWILFTYPKPPGELGAPKDFMTSYLNWLEESRDSRALGALFHVMLKIYPKALPTFELWLKGLRKLMQSASSRRLAEAWQRCRQFHLLDTDGPQLFIKRFIESNMEMGGFLEDAGLTGELEQRGFIKAVYMELLRLVDSSLRQNQTSEHLEQLLIFLKILSAPATWQNDTWLRFPEAKKELAETLLLPYAEGEAPEEQKEAIREFLVARLDDPRISHGNWAVVDNRAKQVILSWLVEVSLEDFFRVLDKTADEIWMHRKAFWSAYLRRGVIEEAWPILGSKAQMEVYNLFKDEKKAFGMLSGAASEQSVLLMRIDNLTIAEWSHNGKCRIWNDNLSNKKRMPDFYNTSTYSASILRLDADYEQVHYRSSSGLWQRKIHDFLAEHTNIRIPFTDFMP